MITAEAQTEVIDYFLDKLLPWQDPQVYLLNGKVLELDRRDNGNYRLTLLIKVAGDWQTMSSIEVAVQDRQFWNSLVAAVRVLLDVTFPIPDLLVAANIIANLPAGMGQAASFLITHNEGETRSAPRPTKRAGRKEGAKEGQGAGIVTIASKGGTKKRAVVTPDEEDVTDFTGSGNSPQ